MDTPPLGSDYWESIFHYATSCLEARYVPEEKLVSLFEEKLLINKDDIMRTIARQIEERGEIRGRQQGMQARNIEVAKNMLQKGLDIKIIEEVTSLNRQTIEELRK